MKNEIELRQGLLGFYFYSGLKEDMSGIIEQFAAIILGLADPVEL